MQSAIRASFPAPMNDLREPAEAPPAAPASEATPAMVQYLEIKRQHPDCLVFYRMGDFYEMFFEDAQRAAAALDIALTKRGRHEGDDIPMCGVPVHAAEAYLSRLIRKGFRVAVCEQMEEPSQRKTGKGPLRRAVVRVVTPGTLTEDTLLDARRHNYLAALAEAMGGLGLAWLDLSTGDFAVQPVAPGALDAALARLAPGELLVADRLLQKPDWFELLAAWKERLTPLPAQRFDSESGRKRLESTFGVATLEGFGAFERAELAAAGALVDYATLTQQGKLPRLTPPQRVAAGAAMEIDAATRRNLELTETLAGERRGSLLAIIDRTVTGAGARLIAEWLAAPLTDPAAIAARHDAIDGFLTDERLRSDLRAALKSTLGASAELRRRLRVAALPALRALIATAERDLGEHSALVDRLGRALGPDLPLLARDGGFIAAGYAAELDELKALRDESRKLIASLQSRYTGETGVSNLKIRHNNVLGYYIEVTAVNAPKLGSGFIHRQTMASAMRFTTTELSELESKILNAADKALALELKLFEDLVGEALARGDEIARTAAALALLDGTAALAELAAVERWCRPEVGADTGFAITGGRHPVVEAALRQSSQTSFVGNDCDLGESQRLWLVTGPNMAGKSTFLRQNALIAILAQMGSFVPAESAALGVVDRLFSRVGAADDLARGRSTFMVEMVETAAILNQATPRSLVILDEIGRGTATFDGLSIAWATVEHLHDVNRCRALFATHYHELTALASRLPALSCRTMRVKEWQDEVVFLHEVAAGAADRSYGIHVAKLAGLPPAVLRRAEEVLSLLEKSEQSGDLARLADDLPLFSAARPKGAPVARESAVEKALAETHPDTLTPREALELLYKLKAMVPKEQA